MELKVNISAFDEALHWSINELLTFDSLNASKLDTIVDAVVSNLKLSLLSHIRNNYPQVWHKDSPLQIDLLNAAKSSHLSTTSPA